VSSAAIANAVPLADRPSSIPVRAVTTVGDAESGAAEFLSVTPEYFSLLNIPLARGRVFRDTDAASSMPVVIIDEEAARLYFPGADAVGRQIHVGRAGSQWSPPSTIIGVVRTVKHTQLNESARPHVYVSFYQRSGRSLSLFVKAPGGASALQEPLRRAVAAVDPELPVFALEPLEETSRRSIARQRFSARALTAFAGMALLLVAGGVYSVVSYAVRTRVREFGIRVAIGASPDDLRWVVLKEALRTSAVGVVVGWVLTASSTRLIEHMLFGVSSADPRVFAAAGSGLIALALLASYLPARRAARIDPVIVLRQE
jgi:putative ABC transport system permease protein